ncbi:MAG: hypothetical protein MUE44_13875 [Oscillatoriaceae cyanobacterium Prado104]|nr:hypothetical protein [Oscillatoriaceae cyanobacterium Prado104]
MKRQALYSRFKALEWQQQLGNLASTLASLSKRATVPQHDVLTSTLLREAALMIEWCAANIPRNYLLELAAMQRELLSWERVFPIEQARSILALHARHQSERLLQMAGFLDDDEGNING